MRVLGDTMVQPRISRPWWPSADRAAEKAAIGAAPHGKGGEGTCPSPSQVAGAPRSRLERNAVKAAAHKVAAVTLASTIGVFGSSQIAFAAGLSTDPGEQPVMEAPGKALVETPLAAGGSASAGSTGTASDTSKDASSEGESAGNGPASSSDPGATDADKGASATDKAADPANGLSLTALSLEPEEAYGETYEAMALAEASFADQVSGELASSSNVVVTLSADEELGSQIAIPAGKQLTIDLNGCTLQCTGGTPFALNDASTLTIIDSSGAKAGVLNTGGSALLMQADYSYQKVNFNLQSGHIACTSLSGVVECVQYSLSGGSVSMSARMDVPANVWVNIQGTCSVTSSAPDTAFNISNGGEVYVLGSAKVTYSGAGAVFTLNRGGVLAMGSGSGAATISASNGNIVRFANSSVDATYNGADIVCNASHPIFTSSAGVSGAKIKFVSGSLSDDSIKSYLGDDAYCVHVPGSGFVVRDQAFVNENCVGVANGVYYYSEADFANATGEKVHFQLVEFTFSASDFAGTSLAGKTEHVHVTPGSKLCDVPGFKLDAAPAKNGYTFSWVRSSTGAKYTQSEVLNLPIAASAQAYSFVGKYEANPVTPPGPTDPDPAGPTDPDPIGPNPQPSEPGVSANPANPTINPVTIVKVPNVVTPVLPAKPRLPKIPLASNGPLPADLAMAAGFTVPESGPGVVVLDELGQPVLPAAENGDGDGDRIASPFDATYSVNRGFGFYAKAVGTTFAIAGGLTLAVFIGTRVTSFMAANASARRLRKRKPVG